MEDTFVIQKDEEAEEPAVATLVAKLRLCAGAGISKLIYKSGKYLK